MVVVNNPTQFPCGTGPVPGSQGQSGGSPPVTGGVLVPAPARKPKPPFPPEIPPDQTLIKCVEIEFGEPGRPVPAAKPGFSYVNPFFRECRPCDGAQNNKGYGPAINPKPSDPGCVFTSKAECEPLCDNPIKRNPRGPGDVVPPTSPPIPAAQGGGGQGRPGSTTGPTTGQTQYYKCAVTQLGICPDEQNLPLGESTIIAVETECQPCSPTFVSSNGQVVVDPQCQFSSLALCQANCLSPTYTGLRCTEPSPTGPTTGPTTGLPTVGETTVVGEEPTNQSDPTLGQSTSQSPVSPFGDPFVFVSVTSREPINTPVTPQATVPQTPSISNNAFAQSVQITNAQQAINGNVVSVTSLIEEELGSMKLPAGTTQPFLFDPNLNFFKKESDDLLETVSNKNYPSVFKSDIAVEIAETLAKKDSNIPWDEVTLQNISDEKLIQSIQPILINSFEYLRYAGGEPIGVSTFLNIIRKHILMGTLDEFDPQFYIDAAAAQFDQKFDVLERPSQKEHAERLAIKYIKDSLNTFQNDRGNDLGNFQINRTRPLNEDVKIHLDVSLVDGTRKDLNIPNEGVEVEKLIALPQVTIPALGAPDKLNIGDGGGYYVSGEDIGGKDVPVYTENIIDSSFYAPAAIRSKVLKLLDIDPAIKITATSNANKHEFAASDAGPSGIAPLFFILDLNTVSGDYDSNALVEDYSGTYVRITSDSDIKKYVNNNALNTPMLTVDYRDPIYRYILDTSQFIASLKDFNLVGFKDKAFSSLGTRLVNNIPFGFVVTPVAGGKYNPFNGNSTLESYGDTHTRSLSVLPTLDSSIESGPQPQFRGYNLYRKDGVLMVGIGEGEDFENIGYEYNEDDYIQTFYSASAGEYGYSASPPSAQGVAYMLREVVDYLQTTYDASTLTWYDVFTRIPMTQMGEIFYDITDDLLKDISNGLRGGVRIENVESGYETTERVLSEDSKTIIAFEDRRGVTTTRV